MQSEDFDKRIREAAENHHPQYNENAWNGMEKLLNKHMPVEKDRRRFIFFLLLAVLLLGGGATWLLTTRPWKRNSDAVAVEKTIAGNKNNTTTNQPGNTGTTTSIPGGTGTGDADKNGQPLNDQTANDNTTNEVASSTGVKPNSNAATGVVDPKQNNVTGPGRTNTTGNPGITQGNQLSVTQGGGAIGKHDKKSPATTDKGNKKGNDKSGQPSGKEVVVSDPPVKDPGKQDIPGKTNDPFVTPPATTIAPPVDVTKSNDKTGDDKTDKKNETVKKDPVVIDPDQVDKKPFKTMKPDRKPLNSLSLTISGGGDISSVRFKNAGKMQSVFGAGLNYSFRDKFIIRSGVYTGHKVYTASIKDYKVDPAVNTTYLERIEANCNILEIPLGVAYNFGKAGGKQNVFAATSLSTFIMKEENYDYVYVIPGTGTTYSYDWDYKNQNKHFFSVLTLSAGYTRSFGKRFSLSAEPYVKFPLTGVGQGKVKLNNSGVLFTFGTKLTGVK